MNPDRLAELEEERRFLLDSIRDIDREFAAGDVGPEDHRVLRDGYVARAAAVLREIEDGRSRLPVRTRWSWSRRVAVAAGTLAVGALVGVVLAQSLGARSAGQSMTGGPEVDEVVALLSTARSQLGSDPVASLQGFEAVLELEPGNVEALTYSGWLRLVAGGADPAIVDDGMARLRSAIETDPTYADAHCLLAVGLANFAAPPDDAAALAATEECLALDPPADMVSMIEALRDRLAAG